jgi:hypothetical protein
MIPVHLMSDLRQLDRVDKLRVMQFLVIELSRGEGALLKAGAEYPVWSPYNAYEAAHTMLGLLKSHQQRGGDAQQPKI